MEIDRSEQIMGIPILKIRDLLKHFDDDHGIAAPYVAERMKLTQRKAVALMRAMQFRGWIAPWYPGKKSTKGFFTITESGLRFRMYRAVRRLKPEKAKQLLAEFIERCAEVDRRDEFAYYVQEARLFGSMLKRQKDYGDIDLLVRFAWRPIRGRDRVDYGVQRARLSGKHFSGGIAMSFYGETEVRLYLRNRSPYISMHGESDPVARAARSRVIFTSQRYP